MPIAGALVIAVEMAHQQELADQLAAESGVEINGVGPVGIAITVETETMKEMTCFAAKVKQLEHVADFQLTYCNWEDLD